MATIWNQIYWLLYRNVLLKIRYKELTFQELFIPLIFVANLATIRFTTQTDPIGPITSSQLQSYSLFDQPGFVPDFPYPIAFTPNTSDILGIMEQVASSLTNSTSPLDVVGYATEAEIVDDVVNGTANVSFAIVFSDDFPTNLTYKIRLPFFSLKVESALFASRDRCFVEDPAPGLASYNCPANNYLYSGFSAIQALVEHYMVKLVSGNTSLPIPDVFVQMFPKGEYFYPQDSLRIVSSIYIVLAYMPFTAVLMTVLVYEKELKIKECMKIMGMNDVAFWLSWTIVYSVIVLVVALIVGGYMKLITIFPGGNFFIIFLGLFLYGLSIVTMAFMFSQLFQKATTAGAMGSLFIMLFVVPYIPLGVLGPEVLPSGVIWILCLFSPTAVAFFIDRSILFEQYQGGVQFSNLGSGYFPPYACLIMLVVDIILYLLLAIYFENVLPEIYGQTRSPFFCLMPSYWCGSSSKDANDRTGLLGDQDNGSLQSSQPMNEDVEPIPAALRGRDGIRIHNVKKVFPAKRGNPDIKAVNGISLDIFEGQITCLLGHNGAGKSTLINCLTGLTRPTDGQATVYGHSIRDADQLQKIRSMTGVCLQENTIFENLSPEEHLKIYAGIKGVPNDQIPGMVDDTLKLIDLETSSATISKNLSGGQKRKLCVGMAIIGNPKVLILDEPSSGMDPYSRRKMWTLLKKQREGRVTLLTTHFMDEADILADRKAIMSKGQLRCYGSSLFLKNKFGVGYHLGLVVDGNSDKERITSLIQSHIPSAKVSRAHGMELAFSLPLKDVSAFAGMFKNLEEAVSGGGQSTAESLGIQSYGVSMTSLEEVFLKIGEEAEVDELDAVPASALNGTSIEDSANNSHSVQINMGQSPLDSTVLATKPIQTSRVESIKNLAYIMLLNALRTPGTFVGRLFIPIVLMIVGGVLTLIIDFGGDENSDAPPPLWFEPSMYLLAPGQAAMERMSELLYKDSLPSSQQVSDVVAEFSRLDIASNITSNLSALFDLRPHNAAVDLMDLGTSGADSMFTAYYNDTAQHSLPILLSTMSNSLLGLVTNDSMSPVITAALHPFPKPADSIEYSWNSGILFVYLFGFGVAFILLGFPVDKVKERQLKIKAQLRISGVDTLTYWTAGFLVDVGQMIIIVIVGFIIIFAMQVPSLTTGGAVFCLIVTAILYTPVAILHAYCLGFIFNRFESAQGYLQFFFFHIPLILFIPVMFLDLFNVSMAGAAAVHLVFTVVYPVYSIYGTLYFIDKVYQYANIFGQLDELEFGDYFAPGAYIWPTWLLLMFDVVMLCFFLRFCEIVKTGGNPKDTCPCLVDQDTGAGNANDDIIDDEDTDVKQERAKVDEIFDSNETPAVAIQDLRREFSKRTKEGSCGGKVSEKIKVAVRNLSLTVKTGEVLGLLGPNGAGKTTTMNVVTADLGPTRGQVRVGGYDVQSSLSSAYEALGFCPQIDPLWKEITMREHLEAFASFKGIHKDDRRLIADNYMNALAVMEHADKKVKEMSGGTKRKCFALSMLGDPQIVLLDEPSTGMDPSSKRFLWNTITSSFVNNKGAILTTHSMEEADAVCSRVGIMISGQLKCLGTTQHLKNKYGGGYTLEIKLNLGDAFYTAEDQTSAAVVEALDEKMEQVHKRVIELFPHAEVTESFAERISYKIPRDTVLTLSKVFNFLEQGKQEFGIEEYSFSQTSLEQVFIEFAKAQVDDPHGEDEVEPVRVTASTNNDPQRKYSSRISVKSQPRPQSPVHSPMQSPFEESPTVEV